MLKRIMLSSLMIFVLITSTVFADDFQVQPDKIVLNSIKGTADTIKVSFPFFSNVTAVTLHTISFNYEEVCADEEQCADVDIDFYYCPIDHILHIYFPKDVVIGFLGDHGIVGDVVDVYIDIDIDCTISEEPLAFEGYGTVEVVNPSKKESK